MSCGRLPIAGFLGVRGVGGGVCLVDRFCRYVPGQRATVLVCRRPPGSMVVVAAVLVLREWFPGLSTRLRF